MATSTPFLPKTTSRIIFATTTSEDTTFSDADKDGDCLRIVIAQVVTAAMVFVKVGRGPQIVTGNDLMFPAVPGVYVIGCDAAADTVAVAVDAGTATISLTKGEGV